MGNKHNRKPDAIPSSVSRQIDENLKRLYDEAAAEELPKNLMDLLDALRNQDAQKKPGDE